MKEYFCFNNYYLFSIQKKAHINKKSKIKRFFLITIPHCSGFWHLVIVGKKDFDLSKQISGHRSAKHFYKLVPTYTDPPRTC